MINLREKRNQGAPAVYGANNPDLPNASGGNQQMSGAPASQEPSGGQSDTGGANAVGVQGAKINGNVNEPPSGTTTGYDRNGNPVSIAPQAGQQIQLRGSGAAQANQADNIVRDAAGNILGTYEAATGGAVGGRQGAHGSQDIPYVNNAAGVNEPPSGTTTGYDRNGNPVSINPEFTQEEVQGGQRLPGQVQQQDNQLVENWSDGFLNVVGEGGEGYEIPIVEAIQDYNRWAAKNNQPALDIVSLAPWLAQRDMSKSAAENEEADRRQATRDRWEQISNVLRHVGNFVGAINYAPAQKIEPMSNLTARQRALRDDSMALRRRDTQTYVNNYLKRRVQEAKDRAAAVDERLKEARIRYENARTQGEKDRAAADVERLRKLSMRYEAEADREAAKAEETRALIPVKKEEIKSRTRKNNRSNRGKKNSKTDNSKKQDSKGQEGGVSENTPLSLELPQKD